MHAAASSISLSEANNGAVQLEKLFKSYSQQKALRCGCGVAKHERRGEMRGLELFMSSNLIKLAPKHFLIFLICLDNPIYAKKPWRRDGNLFRFRFTWNKIKVLLPFKSASWEIFCITFVWHHKWKSLLDNLFKWYSDTFSGISGTTRVGWMNLRGIR